MKTHLHSEQFDGHWHPQCGRGNIAVSQDEFENTTSSDRCKFCENYWYPNGAPDEVKK